MSKPRVLDCETRVVEEVAAWLPPMTSDRTPFPADFDGDGKTDIFWFNTKGGWHFMWLINKNLVRKQEPFWPVPKPWKLAGTGDFNGDEKADMVWYNETDGRSFIMLLDGATIVAADMLRTFNVNWEKIAALGDFNGDGKDGILWHEKNGNNTIWFMYALVKKKSVPTNPTPSFKAFGTGDFNSDGKSDILWSNPAETYFSIWEMNGAKALKWYVPPTIGTGGPIGKAASIGDFNGDSQSNILWRTPKGDNYIWDGTVLMVTIPFRYLYNYDPAWTVIR
ncbi:MAG: VCBS repeat-containing protein [bacterium]|nr:VCBS repeat-containing protein [bacterium]